MNPYQRYRPAETPTDWLRIDVLLALYDGAIGRLDRALAAYQSGQDAAARAHLVKVQLIIAQLGAGVIVEANPELGTNYLRLYEYCLHELGNPCERTATAVRTLLGTLREGFEAIRDDARRLERQGTIPSFDRQRLLSALA